MADACQPMQRNLYQTKFAHLEYRSGEGIPYDEQLRHLSWSVSDDVPAHAQKSRANQPKPAPSEGSVSILDTHAPISMSPQARTKDPVHLRLSTSSKSFVRPASHGGPSTATEEEGDMAFAAGQINAAIQKYTAAIAMVPSAFVYEKRCAAYAHAGKYEAALKDAKWVLEQCAATPKARLRVKDLEDFLTARKNCTAGYETAHVTLLCNLTPSELKMWKSPKPSVYKGP